ncbi:MAG: cytochrome c3 family protein [Gemmatimonadota bacterium]|nr:cytochrome c3 family protein [Gemmatimonadota bacterium]
MKTTKKQRWIVRVAAAVAVVVALAWWNYPRLVNLAVPAVHRPAAIHYPVQKLSDAEFDQAARKLEQESVSYTSVDTAPRNAEVYAGVARALAERVPTIGRKAGFDHVEYFRKAGIREYDGPETCLTCHPTMRVKDGHGGYTTVDTRDNVEHNTHFSLNQFSGFSTYGFNGRQVAGIPMGKIDRACGIPGSFTWTAWATLVKTKTGETRSDGCGQCHVVGQYGPITGSMFPGYKPVKAEFEATDCLLCHARNYDMNQRYVVQDPNGRYRWNQDRSMAAAMTVGRPTSDACLRCHEHNHGGDMYANNAAAKALGYKNPRLLHPGAKRGTPDRDYDVHYRAGVQCLDCHESHGHLIARGTSGTDLVDNDLPGVAVTCEQCHTASPHVQNKATRAFLNAHTDKLACTTCHITHLTDDNVVLRDWTNPVYDSTEGIWLYRDLLRSGKPGEAIVYRWFNGNGTFMAGALGDNPNGLGLYRSFTTTPDSAFRTFDYAAYYDTVLRPVADLGKSKITPFKRFNAKMYEDMGNQGPFGGMLLPLDYNVFYETGDVKAAVMKATEDPIIKLMYGRVFKMYMMDDFMRYMGIEKGWTIPFSGQIEAKWMRQDATLMLSHSVTKDAFQCAQCHTSKDKGIMPFEALGYPPERVKDLRNLEELKMLPPGASGAAPRAAPATATVKH